ncbi:amidinotransferase [Rhizobium sp. P32RR-XVIII]|uniref:dimethylarginine dimethylaminohydrolase family protein n=1 Tax=Rhizobium sp. P32RR-XVIII TaxID=2726738 RepID=UPI001456DC29|nr:amidinotransferase [Rhizobium sp. P32RR-XVIII]NLS02181.1 amidinotransferase [Rhizobium sp. P32RR-XVIII]
MHEEVHQPWKGHSVPSPSEAQNEPRHKDTANLGCGSAPVRSFSEGLQVGQINCPVLLMNLPLSLSTQVPNNAWMNDIGVSERGIRLDRAVSQFQELYKHVTRQAIVYLLPSHFGLQDQTYVSNLGVVLPHCKEDTVIVSRFRTEPRVGEARIGADFFKLMNFAVEQPPETIDGEPVYLEGEADFKWIRGNLYIGAHGTRSSRNALTWAAERFEMEVIPFRVADPYLYHLDCWVFRLTEEAVILCTSAADRTCVREIERHCEIIDISPEEARAGIVNNLLLPSEVLCDSNIRELESGSPKYAMEKAKIDRLEKICARFGRELTVFCMSEFYKSGALLSCLVMHLKHAAKQSP